MAALIRISDTPVILAVDDMPIQGVVVKGCLPNYKVFTAKSAKEALDFLGNAFADLVLLDIEMPEMNGIEMFGKMRETPDFRSIPVVFVTSAAEKERVRTVLVMGAKDFIVKPFTPANLQEKVRNVLGKATEDQAVIFLRGRMKTVIEHCERGNIAAAENTLGMVSPDVFNRGLILKLNRVLTALHNRNFNGAKALAGEILKEL
ncbi:MAG: response regulator [Treponematales bacterium]